MEALNGIRGKQRFRTYKDMTLLTLSLCIETPSEEDESNLNMESDGSWRLRDGVKTVLSEGKGSLC